MVFFVQDCDAVFQQSGRHQILQYRTVRILRVHVKRGRVEHRINFIQRKHDDWLGLTTQSVERKDFISDTGLLVCLSVLCLKVIVIVQKLVPTNGESIYLIPTSTRE